MLRRLPTLAILLLAACTHPPTPPTPQICLSSDGVPTQTLPHTRFTLAWTHSIEKILWEEDWRLDAGQMVLDEARVRGSGAGMEPAPGARLVDGVWHYRVVRREATLPLTHSPFTAGYTLCAAGRCRPLVEWLPGLPEIARVDIGGCATAAPK
ncbi:DUF1850 domain-containing protein [Zoogloeaceae bacterium G21618-S1]|nr:DUF1850 domain-containing protein [Zoogloeaceae bacterium G21618-S1]